MYIGGSSEYAKTAEWLIDDDDPALQQQNEWKLLDLYRTITPDEVEDTTRLVVERLDESHRSRFFETVATGLSSDAMDDEHLASVLKGLDRNAANAAAFLSMAYLHTRLPWHPAVEEVVATHTFDVLPPPPRSGEIDIEFAEQRQQQLIHNELRSDQAFDPAELAGLYAKAPITMAQAAFNAHAHVYGKRTIDLRSDIHLNNEIGHAMRWPSGPDEQTDAKLINPLTTEDRYAGMLTSMESATRERIRSEIVLASRRGDGVVRLQIGLAATGTPQSANGVAALPFFTAVDEGGRTLGVVNHMGIGFANEDAYLSDRRWPQRVPITLLAHGDIAVDVNGNVALRTAEPMHDFLHEPELAKFARGLNKSALGSFLSPVGATFRPLALAGTAYLFFRSVSDLRDRASHDESPNPWVDPTAWTDYARIGITLTNVGLLAGKGVLQGLAAAQGELSKLALPAALFATSAALLSIRHTSGARVGVDLVGEDANRHAERHPPAQLAMPSNPSVQPDGQL